MYLKQANIFLAISSHKVISNILDLIRDLSKNINTH